MLPPLVLSLNRRRIDRLLRAAYAILTAMSEGIALPSLTSLDIRRGELLPESNRLERLDVALPQILAAVDGETDPIVIQATLSALLWETLPQTSWVGFYRRVAAQTLAVGPYQGPMGCLRIDFRRGVCGACARNNETQLVPDVRVFPDHIACDDATLSELVLPVRDGDGRVQAVLDLDARMLSGFSQAEATRLETLLSQAFPKSVLWPTWD
ncbi:GAF domain-containing protein [Pendulispora rubella]|uniref:GAF domain-containing protein n=1 Tax=Pendulispora rubella TaxID=2741070 RepID=A0ABZ2KUV9_9BACT